MLFLNKLIRTTLFSFHTGSKIKSNILKERNSFEKLYHSKSTLSLIYFSISFCTRNLVFYKIHIIFSKIYNKIKFLFLRNNSKISSIVNAQRLVSMQLVNIKIVYEILSCIVIAKARNICNIFI